MSAQGCPHGTFCWADLATTDVAAAKAFYAALFGWTFTEKPARPGDVYTLAGLDRGRVGGVYAQPADMRAAKVPPCWSAYIGVDDVDGLAGRIEQLGGRVLCPPFDEAVEKPFLGPAMRNNDARTTAFQQYTLETVRLPVRLLRGNPRERGSSTASDIPDAGRMATIGDPQGAVVNLWDRQHCVSGAGRPGTGPGTVCWNELATSDLDAAATFYSALFDWAVKETHTPEHVYVEFMLEGEPVGGMLPVSVAGADVPPHWLVYFAVTNCDAAAATAAAHGGQVCKAPFEVADVGRIAVLADPQGAAFAVIAMATRD